MKKRADLVSNVGFVVVIYSRVKLTLVAIVEPAITKPDRFEDAISSPLAAVCTVTQIRASSSRLELRPYGLAWPEALRGARFSAER